jgi:O-antigen/teichoic acid export membrane protein
MGFWSAWRLLSRLRGAGREPLSRLIQSGVTLLFMVVLGVSVGAIQIVPLYELVSRNFREGASSFDTVRGYAYPPRHALAFLMPNLYGSPAEHDYLDVFSGTMQPFRWTRADGSTVTDTFWQVNKNYVEGACYVGILTLALAALSLLDARRKPYRAMLAVLSVISVTFAFGTITYAILYYGLPGVNQLHSPFRWVWPLTLALAALAGFGVDALTDGVQRRAIRITSMILLISGIATIVSLVISRVAFGSLRGIIERLYQGLAGADTAFPNVEAFYSLAFKNILIFGIILIASGGVIWLSRRKGAIRGVPVWQVAAVAVIALDLMIASVGFNPAADPKWLRFEPPAITYLKSQNPDNWRYATVDRGSHPMNANLGMMYGLSDIAGYDSIIPRQYVEYMRQMQPQGMLIYNRIAPIIANQLEVLEHGNLLGLSARWLISEVAINYPRVNQVFEDRGTYIYENTGAVPRTYVVGNGTSALVQAQFNQVTIMANIPGSQPERVVLTDSMFPGWRAFIRAKDAPQDQERETPILLYNGNMRSIDVPPGEWVIRFRYTPQTVQLGALISFIAGIIVVFLLLVFGWRNFAGETGSDLGKVARNSAAPIFLSLFNRAMDFAFAAIMLRVLPPAEVGAYYYAIVIIGWFDILTNFGLNTYLTREVARDPGAAAYYFRRTSLLRVLLTVAWLPLLGAFFGYFFLRDQATADPLTIPTAIAIILLYLSLIPGSLNSGLSALFYAFEKAEVPATISTITSILSVILRLAVLLLSWSFIGLAGVALILNVVTLGILGWQARTLLQGRKPDHQLKNESQNTFRAMVVESWPLMLNHLLATLFFKLDVVLLERFKGNEVVAQYSTSYKWVDAIGVIPAFFTMAMLPLMSRLAGEDKPGLKRNYQLAVKMLVMVALPVSVVTTFLAPILIGALGGARYLVDGTRALQLMIWFIPIGWINSLTQYVLIALNLQRPVRWPFLAGVTFNIAANWFLIPVFSYQAAAIVTILSELVLQIGFYVLLRRELGAIGWVGMLGKPVFAAILMFGAMFLTYPITPIFGVLTGMLVYPAALIVLRPFTPDEATRLLPLLPGPVRRLVNRTT